MKIVINGEAAESSQVSAGDGIAIKDGAISVTVPVKPLTQAEYDALSDEEKQAEAVYVVDEPAWTPVPLSIQEYDTDDGWHVRKYSDGFMVQTIKKEYTGEKCETKWGNLYNTGRNYGPFTYPEAFTEIYQIRGDIIANASVILTSACPEQTGFTAWSITKTPIFGVTRPNAELTLNFMLFVQATGRWK